MPITKLSQDAKDYFTEVALGNVDGANFFLLNANNFNVDTVEQTIWPEGTTYVPPPATTIMTVSSDSALDTIGGVGMDFILILGLDADYNEIEEIVELKGLQEIPTVNSYLRIRKLLGVSAEPADTNTNVGKVYIGVGTVTDGRPATVYNLIDNRFGDSTTGIYTVPAGKTSLLKSLIWSADSGKQVIADLHITPFGGSQRTTGSIFVDRYVPIYLSGAARYEEKTDIDFRATSLSPDADIHMIIEFLEVDNA